MPDDRELQGLDPYDLMAGEAVRLGRFFAGLDGPDWDRASRCAGWSVRDVLAHLASSEDYNRACLDGTVQQLMTEMAERGATDLATANEQGVRAFDGDATGNVLAQWRARSAAHREELRARDGGDLDTSVGPYPVRWQAFHLAFELAVHADDVGAPVETGEVAARTDWQARFCRFALKELRPDVELDARGGLTRVQAGDIDVELTDDVFVQAVAARSSSGTLDEPVALLLGLTP
jgi:uncharacterized protein (TIGR03083 family)